MNPVHYVHSNGTVHFTNSSLCNDTKWNDSLPTICVNLTFDVLNGSSKHHDKRAIGKESQESVIVRFCLIALIFVLIVIGNSLTIHVVRNNRNLTSIKNYYYGYYIVNLSISDLLVGLVCLPTTFLYYLLPGPWVFGLFLCKLFPTLQIMVVSASISTLTVITFERFLAIVHPLKPRSTAKSVRIKLVAIWIWSFIIALPSFIAYKVDNQQVCQEIGIAHWYTIALFLVNYAVPLSFIFVTYIRITCELRMQNSVRSSRDVAVHRKFLKLTVVLVVSFALCFLPSNVVFFIIGYSDFEIDHLTISVLLQYFHILIWFNSCLNPFIYGSVDKYFKRGFKKALGLASSNDSQDKTNLSRMSTFKGEKPAPELYKRLLSESSVQRNNSNESRRSVRFARDEKLDSENNNPSRNTRLNATSPDLSPNARNNPKQYENANEAGYVSLVLYQSKRESNMNPTVANDEESKELYVDLDSRKLLPCDATGANDIQFDLANAEEFIIKFRLSRETVI